MMDDVEILLYVRYNPRNLAVEFTTCLPEKFPGNSQEWQRAFAGTKNSYGCYAKYTILGNLLFGAAILPPKMNYNRWLNELERVFGHQIARVISWSRYSGFTNKWRKVILTSRIPHKPTTVPQIGILRVPTGDYL